MSELMKAMYKQIIIKKIYSNFLKFRPVQWKNRAVSLGVNWALV
jgi:hypothetical protein